MDFLQNTSRSILEWFLRKAFLAKFGVDSPIKATHFMTISEFCL
jgi:hypothetical protein